MWASIKLQFAAYKWAIIIGLFAVLSIAVVIQYHQVSTLKTEQETLEKDKKELEGKVATISDNFNNYKVDVDKAMADLATLRDDLKNISDQTAKLQSRINALGKAPTAGGGNFQEIQNDANQLSIDIFNRLENTSKGK